MSKQDGSPDGSQTPQHPRAGESGVGSNAGPICFSDDSQLARSTFLLVIASALAAINSPRFWLALR
jgi:hypothetical protein